VCVRECMCLRSFRSVLTYLFVHVYVGRIAFVCLSKPQIEWLEESESIASGVFEVAPEISHTQNHIHIHEYTREKYLYFDRKSRGLKKVNASPLASSRYPPNSRISRPGFRMKTTTAFACFRVVRVLLASARVGVAPTIALALAFVLLLLLLLLLVPTERLASFVATSPT
jgi:hypothetical protein